MLWLAAAVGNSTFIQYYYDCRFANLLYAGRRRFMTQYVAEFPLPAPDAVLGRALIALSHGPTAALELDCQVWRAFGFRFGPRPSKGKRTRKPAPVVTNR